MLLRTETQYSIMGSEDPNALFVWYQTSNGSSTNRRCQPSSSGVRRMVDQLNNPQLYKCCQPLPCHVVRQSSESPGLHGKRISIILSPAPMRFLCFGPMTRNNYRLGQFAFLIRTLLVLKVSAAAHISTQIISA